MGLSTLKTQLEMSQNNIIFKTDDDKNSTKNISSRLLNYIEPYQIASDSIKTLFWMEISAPYKVGDRLFIIGGNYDSNELIKADKYSKYTDGYRILHIDKCKVVLDIDYTGLLPYKENNDKFIDVYYVDNEETFNNVNRQMTTNISGALDYKFNKNNDTLIYFSTNFNYNKLEKWGQNAGVSGLTNSGGFFYKNGTHSWVNVTNDILSGSYSDIQSSNEERKLRIKGGFDHNGFKFTDTFMYEYLNNEWHNFSYNIPVLTKGNIRGGIFTGEMNSGLYGVYNEKLEWQGIGTWQGGTLLNTIWNDGEMESNWDMGVTYKSHIGVDKLPHQQIQDLNNNGYGQNLVYNADMSKIRLHNGVIVNTTLSGTYTPLTVNNHIIGTDIFGLTISNCYMDNCKISNAYLESVTLLNSRNNNNKLVDSKLINSLFNNVVIKDSLYLSDKLIKILSYEEWGIYMDSPHTIYKFFIDEESYNKLRFQDIFYINGVTFLDDDLTNIFNKKYRLSSYRDFDFDPNGVEINIFLSTPADNDKKMTYTGNTNNVEPNINREYSLDIVVENGISYSNKINIDNAYILDFDVDSGIFENSDWLKGNSIEYNNDTQIIDINITPDNKLLISTRQDSLNKEFDYKAGDVIYLNNFYYNNVGKIETYTLSTNSGYALTQSFSYNFDYEITSVGINGEILGLSFSSYGYEVGDTIELSLPDSSIGLTASIIVGSVSGASFSVGDSYLIEEVTDQFIKVSEIKTTTLTNIPNISKFNLSCSINGYDRISRKKFTNSKIKEGFFKRNYITNSLISITNYDSSDKDFNDKDKIKKLLVSDSLFYNTKNILAPATYMDIYMKGGSDNFIDGIIYKSVIDGITFNKGTIKQSIWLDGIFNNGTFYQSNDTNYWLNGTFNNGEFSQSDWKNGLFNNGKFYNSTWYDGVFNNGLFGDKTINAYDTVFKNGTFSNGVVDNAKFEAVDKITWLNGEFNDGEFGSLLNATASWENGNFNNGKFINSAFWKNGKFNGGKFHSSYGWTQSGTRRGLTLENDLPEKEMFTWQNGEFNGGEFGNASKGENSTWYDGSFNGGKFQGRVWNDGIFTNGIMFGSTATYSTLGSGTYSLLTENTSNNANEFVKSFKQDFYGLWRNGHVSINKDEHIFGQDFLIAKNDKYYKTQLNNILWLDGTFNHDNSEFVNSVFLSGTFSNGTFVNSSFNPFVERGNNHFEFGGMSTGQNPAVWLNGKLKESEFYYSDWKTGEFISGTAFGMHWEDGVVDYMNAYNVFWEDGLWRNGNWNGSDFNFNGSISDSFAKAILDRGSSIKATQSLHLWNLFEDIKKTQFMGTASAGAIKELSSGMDITVVFDTLQFNSPLYNSVNYTFKAGGEDLTDGGYNIVKKSVMFNSDLDNETYHRGEIIKSINSSTLNEKTLDNYLVDIVLKPNVKYEIIANLQNEIGFAQDSKYIYTPIQEPSIDLIKYDSIEHINDINGDGNNYNINCTTTVLNYQNTKTNLNYKIGVVWSSQPLENRPLTIAESTGVLTLNDINCDYNESGTTISNFTAFDIYGQKTLYGRAFIVAKGYGNDNTGSIIKHIIGFSNKDVTKKIDNSININFTIADSIFFHYNSYDKGKKNKTDSKSNFLFAGIRVALFNNYTDGGQYWESQAGINGINSGLYYNHNITTNNLKTTCNNLSSGKININATGYYDANLNINFKENIRNNSGSGWSTEVLSSVVVFKFKLYKNGNFLTYMTNSGYDGYYNVSNKNYFEKQTYKAINLELNNQDKLELFMEVTSNSYFTAKGAALGEKGAAAERVAMDIITNNMVISDNSFTLTQTKSK